MIIGHGKIIEFFSKSIEKDRIAHAYLFFGPERVGKRTAALEFVKSLQCQGAGARDNQFFSCGKCKSCLEIGKNAHPDVLLIEPESVEEKDKKREKDITIEQVRSAQRQISLFPYYGPYKIVIFDGADRMRREAANALLKTLEEPSGKTIIILISRSSKSLLPTISSRCLSVKFSLVSHKEILENLPENLFEKYPEKEIQKILRQSLGRPGLALDLLADFSGIKKRENIADDLFKVLKGDLVARFKKAELLSKDLEEAHGVLSQWLMVFRDLLLSKAGCADLANIADFAAEEKIISSVSIIKVKNIIRKITEIKKIISNPSFNARLALENLMLNLM